MKYLHLHTWPSEHSNTTPILALHGFTGSGLDFECFIPTTSARFSWYAPDLMGHGQTPISKNPLDYQFNAHLHYLDLISEQISQPFILLGYSMGGRLALKYALERPHLIKQLILISSTPGILDNHERSLRQHTDELLAAKILTEGVAHFIEFWQEQDLIRSQKNIPSSIYQPMLKRKFRNNALGLANSLKNMGTGSMTPLWNRLHEIKFPVTLITGENDTKFTRIAHEIKHHVGHAEHEMIPNAGHEAIWAQNSSVMAALY